MKAEAKGNMRAGKENRVSGLPSLIEIGPVDLKYEKPKKKVVAVTSLNGQDSWSLGSQSINEGR